MIYLDNAATTKVNRKAFEAMRPYFLTKYGNASEYHQSGREACLAVETSRQKIAHYLGAKSGEIIFTSCATEAINLSHKGLVEALGQLNPTQKKHIIISRIEHKAVLETVKHLAQNPKILVTILPVDKLGLIKMADLRAAIRPETVLISIMYVNNEVGTIEPIRKIGLFLKELNRSRKQKIYFHTDATQAMQYLNCRVNWLGVDMLSFSGHKIYAPKGVGALYVRTGTPLIRQNDGGSQEHGLRSGTENVPYIVALGKAVEIVGRNKKAETIRIRKLQKTLIRRLLNSIKGISVTGDLHNRAPHVVSLVIDGVEGEAMVLRLSAAGIYCSSGSACSASDLSASHVLTAMGYPQHISHSSIRFSMGVDTKETDIKMVVSKLVKVVIFLRRLSPQL